MASREFHYALYPEGSYYRRHLDVFQNDDRRRLSLICYLNEPDWTPADGGELVLYTQGEKGEKAVWVDPLPGQLVLMESHILEHEVKPTQRPRLSLTGWFKTH
ncbi:2OG-Fe(II) oxygenase [Robiginitalea aestuariiviva]|uniref:2OG-Fe(II) oxygenase n=1 Tax=Robiginitalea aestuariiviva TaxID=3036903 RepID=UPI0030C6961E